MNYDVHHCVLLRQWLSLLHVRARVCVCVCVCVWALFVCVVLCVCVCVCFVQCEKGSCVMVLGGGF
jgi:hypothetical protein